MYRYRAYVLQNWMAKKQRMLATYHTPVAVRFSFSQLRARERNGIQHPVHCTFIIS